MALSGLFDADYCLDKAATYERWAEQEAYKNIRIGLLERAQRWFDRAFQADAASSRAE